MFKKIRHRIHLPKATSHRQRAGVIIALAFMGLAATLLTQAAISSVSVELENGTRSSGVSLSPSSSASGGNAIQFGTKTATACGRQVQNYTYQVPFGNAIWNQPICGKTRHPQSANYAERFYKWSNLNDGSPAAQAVHGKIGVNIGLPGPFTLLDPEGLSGNWTRNVYTTNHPVNGATTVMKVQGSPYGSNLDGNLPYGDPRINYPDTPIPWNPNWRTGQAADGEIVILEDRPGHPDEGKMYHISGYKQFGSWLALQQCGPIGREDRLCAYYIGVGRDLNGRHIDYRTYEGFLDERGVGLAMLATLVTPEEVKAGEIRHAIGVAIPNTAFGTICTTAQLGTSAEGNTCGTAVAPATKFEWGGSALSPVIPEALRSLYGTNKTIPEGMIFAVDITDAQIDAWIASQSKFNNDPVKANTAKIFARALRDYGMIVADTSGVGAGLQVAGAVNPEARKLWADVGLDSNDDVNMLDGLITATNLYVVNPPLATCPNGVQSRYYCRWSSIRYTD